MGYSDPVTINKLCKSHEREWEMLEKQFQDVKISPLKLGSFLWKAIGKLVIWSNRVLTSARNACCHLISGNILLHGQMLWSHIPFYQTKLANLQPISSPKEDPSLKAVWKTGRFGPVVQHQHITKHRGNFRKPVQVKIWGKNLNYLDAIIKFRQDLQ